MQNYILVPRCAVGEGEEMLGAARDLVGENVDVIMVGSNELTEALKKATTTVPVVFIAVADPDEGGLVASLARPGGNMTGFAVMEPSLGPKLLELLKQIAPRVARVAVLFNQANNGNRQIATSTVEAASRFGVEVALAPVRGADDIEAAVAQRGGDADLGLIVPPDPATNSHRKLIIDLAARHRLPAIHGLRSATAEGALMSYGVDIPELFRQAATYADRILKGVKTADLPVQLPTKFELVINLNTARALGLTVPTTLLATADNVIE
jgi:putative ABC transport system substrate-binding protein